MTSETRPVTDLLVAFVGPIVWAGHFFAVYLTEALVCPSQGWGPQATVRSIGAALTALALAVLFAFAIRQRGKDPAARDSAALFFALPLTILSVLAILWTSVPLFLLPACAPGGA
jgi:hypothetical protein